jgi:hypothetical protein
LDTYNVVGGVVLTVASVILNPWNGVVDVLVVVAKSSKHMSTGAGLSFFSTPGGLSTILPMAIHK